MSLWFLSVQLILSETELNSFIKNFCLYATLLHYQSMFVWQYQIKGDHAVVLMVILRGKILIFFWLSSYIAYIV